MPSPEKITYPPPTFPRPSDTHDAIELADISPIPQDAKQKQPTQSPASSYKNVSWWNKHVSVLVPVDKRRDHLALERTFLAYLRTSLALSMIGVMAAQVLRLKAGSGRGTGLAAGFVAASIVVVVCAAVRFWRQQRAMVGGKVWAGGFEMIVIAVVSVVLTVATLAISMIES